MADIRLKNISIETDILLNSQKRLTVRQGDLFITNTTISTDISSGSLILNGGIGINCTYDATSITSGGALSIGGGLSVFKKVFLGNNLILDSDSSILSIKGSTYDRLFLDSTANKRFYISLDGSNKHIDLYDTYLKIGVTTNSTNATTGSLIIDGGVSINNTVDSVNSSNGGALTVSGGLAVGGNTYFSKTLTLGQTLKVRYTGTSQIALEDDLGNYNTSFNMINDDLIFSNNSNYVFNTSTGNFSFNNLNNTMFVINQNNSVFSKSVSITDTIESLNNTTGSLLLIGGLSIKCSTDATSVTSGGALTISGGLSVDKKIYTNNSIGIELENGTKNNKIVLYQENNDLTQSYLFSGIGITTGSNSSVGSMTFHVPSNTTDYIFYSSLSSGNSSNEVFRIKGTNEVQFIGDSQKYSFKAGGYTSSDLSIQSQNTGADSSICFYTADGDVSDDNHIKLFGLGLPNEITNSEYLQIGWTTSKSGYVFSSNKNGSGIPRPILLETSQNSGQITLITDGSVLMTSTKVSSNTSTSSLVLSGGLSIISTENCSSISNGGSITTNGGISIRKSIYIGETLNIFNSNGNTQMYANNIGDIVVKNINSNYIFSNNDTSGTYTSNISLFSMNDNLSNNYELLSILTTNTSANGVYNINSKSNGTGILRPIHINVDTNTQLFMHTNGNIGVNTTTPNYQLDINGTLNANNYNHLNELTIYNTNDATSIYTSGSLTVKGGASIEKSLYVGGNIFFTNTLDSSSTSASVFMSGGLTLISNQICNNSSGALTVLGGGYFGESIFVNNDLNVKGNINISGGSLYTSIVPAINLTSGSLLTEGGIVSKCSVNSLSVNNGGSILTPGGASIGKDLYLGGDLYNYGITKLYNSNLVNIYDNNDFNTFSFDRNITTNAFSISRYDLSGTFIEKSIEISRINGIITLNNSTASVNMSSGSLISLGGVTIAANVDATGLSNGGSLTVFGGTSLNNSLFVGGVSRFLNSTVSNNSNEGAVIIEGGVGINGNVNIGGNTVVTGNLIVNGTTTSVDTINTEISDNTILLNSAPSGTSDAGFMIKRYQTENDIASGDIVSDINDNYTFTIPSQSGLNLSELKLSIDANPNDNYYTNYWVRITSGFSVNQVRQVIGYVGSTRVLTLNSPWTIQNPSISDSVNLYKKIYTGIIWDELNDRFNFGSTVQENDSMTTFCPIYCSNATFINTIPSINSNSGTIVTYGGIGINDTTDATSTTQGGGLTVAGGASIAKNLYVGNSLYVNNVNISPNTQDINSTVTFSGANNVTNSPITPLIFDDNVSGIDIFITIKLISTTNLYSNYHIRGVNKITSWDIIQNYIGDYIVTFSITQDGQIEYTCPDYTGFVSLTFKIKCITN